MTPLHAWLSAFVFTQIVEVPIYARVLRRLDDPLATPAALALAFGASAVTHPIVWFLIPRIPASSYATTILRAETFAVAVEALYLHAFTTLGPRRSFVWALVANAASLGLGMASRATLGWP